MSIHHVRKFISTASLVFSLGFVAPGSALVDEGQCHTRKFTEFSHPGGRNRFTFECGSLDGCTEYCSAEPPTGGYVRDARLIEQLSEADCIEGVSWGYQGMGWVWTDHGCEGVFEAFTY